MRTAMPMSWIPSIRTKPSRDDFARRRNTDFLRRSPVVQRPLLTVLFVFLAAAGCDSDAEKAEPAPTSGPANVKQIERTAQSGPLAVTVSADRDRAQIAEPIRLTIRVSVEAGVQVGVPKIEGILGDFEVKESTERDPECEEYRQCREWHYTLECVMPGIAVVPALPFSYEDPREKADGSDGVVRDELTTEAIEITVEGTLADLKGPMDVPIPREYKLLFWAAGTILVVSIVAIFVRWLNRRTRAETAKDAEPALPPHIWALRELDRLEAEKLIERGMIQEHYFRVNLLLRQYIERRFELMAGEQTSEEFIRALQDSFSLDESHKTMLRRFTAACDPVKYARQTPSNDEIQWVGRFAREFITQTKPGDQVVAEAHSRPALEGSAA